MPLANIRASLVFGRFSDDPGSGLTGILALEAIFIALGVDVRHAPKMALDFPNLIGSIWGLLSAKFGIEAFGDFSHSQAFPRFPQRSGDVILKTWHER